MDRSELTQYLGYLLEAEKNVHALTRLSGRLNNGINNLGKERDIDIAVRYYQGKPSTGKGAVIGTLTGTALGFLKGFFKGDYSFLGAVSTFMSMLVFAFIGVFAGMIAANLLDKLKRIAFDRREKSEWMDQYRTSASQDAKRVKNELILRDNVIKYKADVDKQLSASKQVLQKLYSPNIIHTQFRNIIAIASFYQYLDTGMCSELEGHEGAYTLFMHETWFGEVNANLRNIIDRLDQIHAGQFVLLNTMNEVKNSIDQLTKTTEVSLDYAKATYQNSRIIAYNTEVAAKNTEFLNWLSLYNTFRS